MAAAAAKGPITSKALVDNVDVVLKGSSQVDVGPTLFKASAAKIAGGDKINLNGTLSPMDYDTTTGEAPVDTSVWCIALDPNTGKSLSNLATGQYFNATPKQLTGTFKRQ